MAMQTKTAQFLVEGLGLRFCLEGPASRMNVSCSDIFIKNSVKMIQFKHFFFRAVYIHEHQENDQVFNI